MDHHFWNERYQAEAYAYGESPNQFLVVQLGKLSPCSILFPAEGEGRNAVYAATQGFEVCAFDQSEEGKRKAELLSDKHHVSINYFVNAQADLPYQASQFDAMALIFAHFPTAIKSSLHQQLTKLIKPGGVLIFEAFSKNHLGYRQQNPAVGGPADLDMLFSEEELVRNFPDFEFEILREEVVTLNEGTFHNGTGSVIRALARKKA
jgi:2-polyprenyl-3-methyl-5-hydroxy-6-metoxy-1,4-benzoquinol methylase